MEENVWEDVLLFAAVGFAAQVIDGALGMAYGVTATTVLLSFGVAPSVASASVHAAEVFTTGASGLAHWWVGNVDKGASAPACPPRHAWGSHGGLPADGTAGLR